MFSSTLALALALTQQPSNQIKYLPSANLQVLFSRDLEPVPPKAESQKESKGRLGWSTESQWQAAAPRGKIRLTHWTYSSGAKPLMTPKEIATELYSNSELVSSKEELEQAYANRQVIEAKLASYPATIDLHLDKTENLYYGFLAFGDEKDQWLVEVTGNRNWQGWKALSGPSSPA